MVLGINGETGSNGIDGVTVLQERKEKLEQI
jgi:hypothetical protein